MTISHKRIRIAQTLVVLGWVLLIVSSLSIGRFDGNTERSPAVANFVANMSKETFGAFFGWMFGVVLVTSPGVFLGLLAWSISDLRSAKLLTIMGLGVVLFAILYNFLP